MSITRSRVVPQASAKRISRSVWRTSDISSSYMFWRRKSLASVAVVGRVGVDVAEVVGERPDVVVVVLGPAGEVVALEHAVGPGLGERGVLGLTPLDRVLERLGSPAC